MYENNFFHFSIVLCLVRAKTGFKKTGFYFFLPKKKKTFFKNRNRSLGIKKTKTEPTSKFPYRRITNIYIIIKRARGIQEQMTESLGLLNTLHISSKYAPSYSVD